MCLCLFEFVTAEDEIAGNGWAKVVLEVRAIVKSGVHGCTVGALQYSAVWRVCECPRSVLVNIMIDSAYRKQGSDGVRL